MVFQRKPDYESCSHQVTAMPHVPKSARGKRSIRKKDNQMCAFDLLATVAGKLLTEGENSLANINGIPTLIKNGIKKEHFDDEVVKPFKTQVLDQDSCNESTLVSNIGFPRQANHIPKEEDPQATPLGIASPPISAFAKTDALDKESSMISCTKAEFGCNLGVIPDRWSPDSMESGHCREDAMKMPLGTRSQVTYTGINKNAPDMYNLLDPLDLDAKPPPLVSSDSSGEMPSYGDHICRSSSFPRVPKGTEFPVDRDDDDNSSGCTHPSTATNRAFRPNCIGDRRVKKSLACKYRKITPTRMHKGDLSYSDVERKPAFRSKKLYYTRQRTQRSAFKRRKLLDRRSVLTSQGGFFGQGLANSNANGTMKVEARDAHVTPSEANKTTSSMAFQKSSCGSKDYHVKLSIKSFKVPELLIEIPETATVGSLKRTVLEAVNAILGGGLRVGVLHQGKKVRDDNKTLEQAGISHGDMLDNLGFSLEPNCTQAPAQLTVAQDSQLFEAVDTTEPLARIPPAHPTPKHGVSDCPPQLALTPIVNCHESDHDSVHFPADISSPDKNSANSRAIVPVPSGDSDAMAVVPLHKAKRSEHGQRRIRRPFSVSEVEALVQAVEKLGTGRWRDVKLRAFDNAKHRTYVDLKDKWKTLVHTASISPQQRRGEPVPQELLDRVLLAQAYWSQQQAKLQPKTPPVAEARLLA